MKVFILFRSNPANGLPEVRGVCESKIDLGAFLTEETNESRWVEEWLTALHLGGAAKLNEWTQGNWEA